jgi:oligopeptide transport system substrate-binding protein
MNVKRWTHLVFGLLVITLMLVPSVKFTSAQEPKVLRTAVLPGDFYIDPSLGTWQSEILIINELFTGLTVNNVDTVVPEPGLATEWSASDDGTTYTFKLMDNVPWVRYDAAKGEVVEATDDAGNVRYVTAQDIVYGANRTWDPATASQYAGTMQNFIVNGPQKLAGDAVDVAVTAVDDHTVQLTAPHPAAFLPQVFGMWTFRPQPKWAIDEYGDAWTEPGLIETYGPYTVKEWEHGVTITLVKNPFWPGTATVPQAKIDEVVSVWLDEPAMLAAFEAGELDWIPSVPVSDLPRLRVQYPDELKVIPDICTYYYGFNTTKAPTDNVHLRRALSMAIDRDTIVQILGGGQIPAGFFTRPDVAAGPDQNDYPDLAIHSDPAQAKAELQAYFDETGTTLQTMPSVGLMTNTSSTHVTLAQAIQQMWKETLGIEVQYTTQDSQTYNATLRSDAPNVWRLGWCYDYPDASSFIDTVFHTKGPDSNNYTNWGTDEFYSLLDEALVAPDVQARKDLYAQAENLLVNKDAAIAPIYYYTLQTMTQKYVERSWSKDRLEHWETWDILPH